MSDVASAEIQKKGHQTYIGCDQPIVLIARLSLLHSATSFCTQATNGTNATVTADEVTPTEAVAPAPSPEMALAPDQPSAAAQTSVPGHTSSPSPAPAHRGRSLLNATIRTPEERGYIHCRSAMQLYARDSRLILSTAKFSSIVHALKTSPRRMWTRIHDRAMALAMKPNSPALKTVLKQTGSSVNPQPNQPLELSSTAPHAASQASDTSMQSIRQSTHAIQSLRRCMHRAMLLIKHTKELLIGFSHLSSSAVHLPCQGGPLHYEGQPWWPFLPWCRADRQSRAGRVLAEGPGVDLVVTVNVPAGQNNSDTTARLQQSLSNEGALCCTLSSKHCGVGSEMLPKYRQKQQ